MQGSRTHNRFLRSLAAFSLFAAAALSFSPTAIGNPVNAEVLRKIPTQKLSDQELVDLFLSEDVYRWQSVVKIFVDFGSNVPSRYKDCIDAYILERLKKDPRTSMVNYAISPERAQANLLVQFDHPFRIEDCPVASGDPAIRIVRDPPRAFSCISLFINKSTSEITRAEVKIPAEALWEDLDLIKTLKSNFCHLPVLPSAISYTTGVFAPARFRASQLSSYQEYNALEVVFTQILYSGRLDGLQGRREQEREVLKMIGGLR